MSYRRIYTSFHIFYLLVTNANVLAFRICKDGVSPTNHFPSPYISNSYCCPPLNGPLSNARFGVSISYVPVDPIGP